MRRKTLITTALILLVACPMQAIAGEFNPDRNIGDPAPKWEKLPSTDGKSYSLDDFSQARAIVIVFTCNSCPYAVDAEDRLLKLDKFCKTNDAQLIAVNVNKVNEDLMPAMQQKAKDRGFKFPFLFDETQKIAKDYGARYTPESFLLDADRKVAYMGSIDDSPDGQKITKHYLMDALRAVLDGKSPELAETVPIGCRIRFERIRRTRRKP